MYSCTNELSNQNQIFYQDQIKCRENCRLLSALHEAHASFMGVPQSTECGFCWILSPSLENSSSFSLNGNIEKIRRHASARHEVHAPSWGFHSQLSGVLSHHRIWCMYRETSQTCFSPSWGARTFMGVPQSTDCSFCWILSPSLGNSSSFSLFKVATPH